MNEVERFVDPPAQIVCVECGGDAFLLTHLDEGEQVEVGTVLAYRCKDCMDRWDIEMGDES